MNKYIASIAVLVALTGCNSDEKEAQALVDQARGLWDEVMPAPPETRGGNIVFNRESIAACGSKLGDAKQLLEEVATKHTDSAVWASEKTQTLNARVRNQGSTCNQVKYAQGW